MANQHRENEFHMRTGSRAQDGPGQPHSFVDGVSDVPADISAASAVTTISTADSEPILISVNNKRIQELTAFTRIQIKSDD